VYTRKMIGRIFIIVILVILVGLVGTNTFVMFKQSRQLNSDLAQASVRLEDLAQKNKSFESDISFYSDPQNLETELRSKFNYRKPSEKMIVIVPGSSQ